MQDVPADLLSIVRGVEADRKAAAKVVEKDEDSDKKTNMTSTDEATLEKDANLVEATIEKFSKAQVYGQDKMEFSIVKSLFDIIVEFMFLAIGTTPYLWVVCVGYASQVSSLNFFPNFLKFEDEEYLQTFCFFVVSSLFDTVRSLPWSLWSTFKIEEHHGFNKMTLRLYAVDKVKSFVLSILIGGPLLMLFIKVIKWGGDNFYVYLWAFFFVVQMVMMTVVPEYIMPLYNTSIV